MKKLLKRFWWVLLIVAVVVIWRVSCKNNPVDRVGGWWHSIFNISHFIPQPGDPQKPDSDVVHTDKPVIPFDVGEVSADQGDVVVLIPMGNDSITFQQIKIPIEGPGKIRLYVDPVTGRLVIDRQRFGFDFNVTTGPTVHGMTLSLESLFINDFLGFATIRAVTPAAEVSIWNEDRGDVYVGPGAAIDIWQKHSPIRLQGMYEWNIEDLRQSRISAGLTIPIFF